jgi:glycosyltransferase involved in cell wall biosynthesis
MKIAFDHQIFCRQSVGGVSRYYVNLAKQLHNKGQDIGLFAPLHRNRYIAELPSGIVHGFEMRYYLNYSARLLEPINRFLARPMIASFRPDIVHETYFSGYRSGPRNCPVVITVHDMIHELFPSYFPPAEQTARLKRQAIDQADHVICVSENTKADLVNLLSLESEKISVVYHGVEDFPEDSSDDEDSPDDIGDLGANKPYFLYVGGRPIYKNFSGFLKAMASSQRLMRDFDIVVFGGGDLTPDEIELIKSLGFSDRQIQHRSGADSVLIKLYRNARALVYPSLYEGFGLPPLEAMANGCPVISSNISSLPEIVGNAACLFDPTKSEDMADAMARVAYDEDLIKELCASGRQRAREFSWERCAVSTLAVYEKLI